MTLSTTSKLPVSLPGADPAPAREADPPAQVPAGEPTGQPAPGPDRSSGTREDEPGLTSVMAGEVRWLLPISEVALWADAAEGDGGGDGPGASQ